MLASGVATSQTTVNNNQTNANGMFADQTAQLNVVEDVSLLATAAPNTYSGSASNADIDLISNQTNTGAADAHGELDLTGSAGTTTIATSAIGNAGAVTVTGATISGVIVQTNQGAASAKSQVEAEDADTGDITETTLAAGNSHALTLVNGSAGARISQYNDADVAADGGAVVKYLSGTAIVAGTAAGNNIDLTGVNQSAARVVTDQYNPAANVTATQFANYGNSYMTTTAATASGNNLNAANDGTLLDVTTNQANAAYVRAQAVETSYDFGGAQATAYGVGNSVLAINTNGPGLVLDNVQLNTGGGVEVIASFEGNSGYDAGASATAVGNAVSGYVCNQCSGSMSVNNTQSNYSDVSARSTVTVGGAGRSVVGVSTATGNTATFSVTN
ncbi:holdfast anchor protein HfaD [Caulobacter soli]|uniref:holdfast anchor protein HfaD n=1 Tax=Caulobacter soli TaxID=2708539 RepID=UPI0031B606D7